MRVSELRACRLRTTESEVSQRQEPHPQNHLRVNTPAQERMPHRGRGPCRERGVQRAKTPDDTLPGRKSAKSPHRRVKDTLKTTNVKCDLRHCQRLSSPRDAIRKKNQRPVRLTHRPVRRARFQKHTGAGGLCQASVPPAELTVTSSARRPARTVRARGCHCHDAERGFFQESDLATYSQIGPRTGMSRNSEPSRKLFHRNY